MEMGGMRERVFGMHHPPNFDRGGGNFMNRGGGGGYHDGPGGDGGFRDGGFGDGGGFDDGNHDNYRRQSRGPSMEDDRHDRRMSRSPPPPLMRRGGRVGGPMDDRRRFNEGMSPRDRSPTSDIRGKSDDLGSCAWV